jgi:hypothetical protein
MDRRRDAGKSKIQLANLRALSAMPPRTKSGQVTWAWPEIQASLSSGRSLREIWEALQRDGIQMSYNQFRVYVSRIRKRIAGKPELMLPRLVPASDIDRGAAEPLLAQDPLANIRREQERKRASGFAYNPFPDNRK